MAASPCFRLLPLVLSFLLLINGGIAQSYEPRQQQQQPQPRLRAQSECRIDRISAREPNRRVQSEAGVTEYWDAQNDELDCAGVQTSRHVIQPRGLLLPYYSNTPQLIYIIQGQGIEGRVLSGCAETFETSISSESESQGREGGTQFVDRHQKVHRFRAGDVLVLQAGVVHWTYNDGDTPIISVSIRDTSNAHNQLDRTFRKFFLAGRPHRQQVEQGGERGSHSQGQGQGQGQGERAANIFNGFDDQLLQEVLNVDAETVRQLNGENDERGSIVYAERFEVVSPEFREREWEQGRSSRQERRPGGQGGSNGLEETLCSSEFRASLGNQVHANVFNPRGGRLTTLNSYKLPILRQVQLSAERGVLYRNALLAPHYNLNAHSVIYVTRGSGRIQIVRNDGMAVFDGEVREGQLIVVPQNFAMVKRAGEEGFDWVAFKTNDNAMMVPLAGRYSVIRGLPEDVLANSYGISREQASRLKNSRQEGLVFSPSSSSRSWPGHGGMNALLNVLFR